MGDSEGTCYADQSSGWLLDFSFENLTILFFLTIFFALCFGWALYFHDTILALLSPLPAVKAEFPFEDHTWNLDQSDNKTDASIEPWSLDVADKDLDDLYERLQRTRFGTPLQGENFAYGFPGDQLKKVVNYWLTNFDWRKQEELINEHEQFKTTLEGLDIHFVRVRPAKVITTITNLRVVPIILLHGWPGSFFEFYKLIPWLITPEQIGRDQVVFEVIIPSLPGYGFSDGAQKPGLGPRHIARILHKLMSRLDFDKYFIHGGDWGSVIGRTMAVMYPEHVLGLNITMYQIPRPHGLVKAVIARFTPSWIWDVAEPQRTVFKTFFGVLKETGYMHIQATKPDTVGAALLNDPAGLAAYILEKFSTWTNPANINVPDGGLTEYFTLDDLLTNVMVYWISGSIITSQRLYKEFFSSGMLGSDRFSVLIPTLLSDFGHELPGANPPNAFVLPYYKDLVRISKHSSGGHFPSLERPADVAGDIWHLAKTVLQRDR